jgi:hypothetical protein
VDLHFELVEGSDHSKSHSTLLSVQYLH